MNTNSILTRNIFCWTDRFWIVLVFATIRLNENIWWLWLILCIPNLYLTRQNKTHLYVFPVHRQAIMKCRNSSLSMKFHIRPFHCLKFTIQKTEQGTLEIGQRKKSHHLCWGICVFAGKMDRKSNQFELGWNKTRYITSHVWRFC